MRRTTILLADDHPQICAVLQRLLEPAYEVIGIVTDGRALVKTAVELKPDLVLVDVGLPLLNGLEAGRELKRRTPGLKVLFLTMNSDPDIAREAMRIGASGYILKSAMGDELLPAIDQATRGES